MLILMLSLRFFIVLDVIPDIDVKSDVIPDVPIDVIPDIIIDVSPDVIPKVIPDVITNVLSNIFHIFSKGRGMK